MSAEDGGAESGPWHPPVRGSQGRPGLFVAGLVLLVAAGVAIWSVAAGEPERAELADVVETDDVADVEDVEGNTEDVPADSASAEDGLVAEFSGDGDAVTDTFEVEGRWQIRWTHEGDEVEITLLWEDPDRRPVTFTGRGGRGTTYPSDRGELALQVTTDGRWELSVYETVDDD